MHMEMEELERALLKDPFDAAARREYAELLGHEQDWERAAEQWTLLIRQSPNTSDLHSALADVHDMLGDEVQSRAERAKARACPDYDATKEPTAMLINGEVVRIQRADDDAEDSVDPPLPAHFLPDRSERAPQPNGLRLVSGGKPNPAPADVVSISRSGTVRFSDVVGMTELKKLLRVRIIEPFVRPGLFQRFKKNSGGGVLLYGPPGCGKTLIARAIASECNASFTAVGISDILNMYIGKSEQNLAEVFAKARADAPAVLFFDELDALAFSRSKAHSEHTRTLVNEFLAQLDGMSGNNDKLLVLAATNMPWDVDDAMKRPGRFDRQVFVPPPDAQARGAMLEAKLRDVPCEAIDFDKIARKAAHFSGADIDGLIEHAKDATIHSIIDSGRERRLAEQDLLLALEDQSPSTLEWLKTSRNLIKFGGGGKAYKDVEAYLRSEKLY